MTEPIDYPTTSGRVTPCCPCMRMALANGYFKKGFLYYKYHPPMWCFWTLNVRGDGFVDISPIHFCPFCGANLDQEGD